MGTTEKDWQALGRACLLALRPELATAAYLRSRDARMLHACACLAQKKAQGQPDDHLHAYALALLVSRLLLNDTAFQFMIRRESSLQEGSGSLHAICMCVPCAADGTGAP